jgi:hypothetical protein
MLTATDYLPVDRRSSDAGGSFRMDPLARSLHLLLGQGIREGRYLEYQSVGCSDDGIVFLSSV